MKTTVKRLGIEDGRIAYEILIRKSHFLEDYTEMVRIQESSNGNLRAKLHFEVAIGLHKPKTFANIDSFHFSYLLFFQRTLCSSSLL